MGNRIGFIIYGILSSLLFLTLWGCRSESEEGMETVESIRVPVVLNLSAKQVSTSRAVEDNKENGGVMPDDIPRDVHVDHIRLSVYRRSTIGKIYYDDEAGFRIDPHNQDIVLPCKKDDQSLFYEARGSIEILKGQEYRVTAVAYSEAEGEEKLFTMEEEKMGKHCLKLLQDEDYKTPELFFGSLKLGDDIVFPYEKMEETGGVQPLEGWMYRGVAGIELNLTDVEADVAKVELMAEAVHTSVVMKGKDVTDDDATFFVPSEEKQKADGFLLGEAGLADGVATLKGPNLLPIKTSLGLRITKTNNDVSYYRLRMKEVKQIGPNKEEVPVTSEASEELTLERNHYYRIVGSYDNLGKVEYALTVIVNPLWEGDVNLSLERD